jgi:hypothetical protein
MRNPWIIAQLAIAAVLAALALIGIIGTVGFDAAELVFSFAGGIQAFAIFPGLVVSLVLNVLLMRVPGPGRALKIMLGIEFALIALLLVFHFYTDPAGMTLFYAIVTWPIVIALAVAVAVVSIVRLSRARAAGPAPAIPVS